MKNRILIIRVLVSIGLMWLTISIYVTTLDGKFLTSWDDSSYVKDNLLIRDLGINSIYKIFTTPSDGSYQPLINFSFAIDYYLSGLEPFGFHLTNTLLHILNSLLVYAVLLKFIRRHETASDKYSESIAALGAFIFAAHPVNVESVAWITERKNVLSMIFILLSYFFYLKYKEVPKRIHYDLSLAMFLLALLSKSVSVVFPLLITFYDLSFYWKRGDNFWRKMVDKLPFFILAGAAAVLQILSHSVAGYIHTHPGDTPLFTFYIMLKVVNIYVRNAFLPLNLSAIYNIKLSTTLWDTAVLLSISSILIIIATALYLYKKRDMILFYSIILFFVPLLPVINIVKLSNYMADRYLYLPIIGFSILVSVIMYRICNLLSFVIKDKQTAFYVYILLSVFIVYEYSVLSINRGGVWQDDVTLWEDNLKTNKDNGYIYNILANIYATKGQYNDALAYSTKALELNPNNISFEYQRAFTFIMIKDYKRAERYLKKTKKQDPSYSLTYYGFGNLYTLQGRFDEADIAWKRFLELFRPPDNIENPFVTLAKTQIDKYKKVKSKGESGTGGEDIK